MWAFNRRNRDINQLIYDCAEYQRDGDFWEICRYLNNRQVFAPIVSQNFTTEYGEKVTLQPGMEVALSVSEIQGKKMWVFYVNQDDARITTDFIGIDFWELMAMVERGTTMDGFIIYNNKISYFGLLRASFPEIRRKFRK